MAHHVHSEYTAPTSKWRRGTAIWLSHYIVSTPHTQYLLLCFREKEETTTVDRPGQITNEPMSWHGKWAKKSIMDLSTPYVWLSLLAYIKPANGPIPKSVHPISIHLHLHCTRCPRQFKWNEMATEASRNRSWNDRFFSSPREESRSLIAWWGSQYQDRNLRHLYDTATSFWSEIGIS